MQAPLVHRFILNWSVFQQFLACGIIVGINFTLCEPEVKFRPGVGRALLRWALMGASNKPDNPCHDEPKHNEPEYRPKHHSHSKAPIHHIVVPACVSGYRRTDE